MDYTQYSTQQVISNYAAPQHFHFHLHRHYHDHVHSNHHHPAQAQQHHNKLLSEDPDVYQGHQQGYLQSGYQAITN